MRLGRGAIAAVAFQGCKSSEQNMAELVKNAKINNKKADAKYDELLTQFQKDVEDVPKVEGKMTPKQNKSRALRLR